RPPQAPDPAILKQVLATANGEPITRRDLLEFLSQYQIPPEDRDIVYNDAMETLVNTRLVTQYLNRLKIPVSEERVNEAIGELEKQLKQDGTSLAQSMVESGKDMAQIRKVYADRIRWVDFVRQRGTDAELKKFQASHKDLLNGTQVKAAHILLKVDPKSTPAQREQIRQKLVGIKRDIEGKKVAFAEAANKYSEDPANSQGAGGDIGYFGLTTGIVEEFGKAAFALKPGQLSDPVETPYGYHLILVSDRKDGTPIDFEQNKPLILNAYAAELQKDVLTAQRKTAKVDIKPMPADLFPPMEASPLPAQTKGAATKGTQTK
ncbi:peptidylprolyl isomerase, partial [Singulisphaera rosea]